MKKVNLVNSENKSEIMRLSTQLSPMMADFNVMSAFINCVLPYMPNAVVDSTLGWWTLSIVSYLSQYIGGRYVRSMACRTAWTNRHLVESQDQEDYLAECLLSEDRSYLPRQAQAINCLGINGYRAACRLAYYAHQHQHAHYLKQAIKRLTIYEDHRGKAVGNPIAEYHLAVARYELMTRGTMDLERCVRMIAGLKKNERQIYAIELCSFAPITSREIGIIMAQDNPQLVGGTVEDDD